MSLAFVTSQAREIIRILTKRARKLFPNLAGHHLITHTTNSMRQKCLVKRGLMCSEIQIPELWKTVQIFPNRVAANFPFAGKKVYECAKVEVFTHRRCTVMTRIVVDKSTYHAKPHSICFLPQYQR